MPTDTMSGTQTQALPKPRMKRLFVALAGMVVFLVLGVIFLRLVHLERGVPKHRIDDWVEANEISKLLVVFAHQDDELLVAGTLVGLDGVGVDTMLLTVTNGDGTRRREGQTVEHLIAERATEVEASAKALRVDALEQGMFSDAGFMDVPDADIKQVILDAIGSFQPDTIITWDTVKGMYGHPHHVRVGQLVVEVCRANRENPDFSVQAVYGSTVSVWIREVLKRLAPVYKRRYYEINDQESVVPEFSLATKTFSDQRRAAFAAYEKRAITQSTNPLSGAPHAIQDFVFDREYFYRSY